MSSIRLRNSAVPSQPTAHDALLSAPSVSSCKQWRGTTLSCLRQRERSDLHRSRPSTERRQNLRSKLVSTWAQLHNPLAVRSPASDHASPQALRRPCPSTGPRGLGHGFASQCEHSPFTGHIGASKPPKKVADWFCIHSRHGATSDSASVPKFAGHARLGPRQREASLCPRGHRLAITGRAFMASPVTSVREPVGSHRKKVTGTHRRRASGPLCTRDLGDSRAMKKGAVARDSDHFGTSMSLRRGGSGHAQAPTTPHAARPPTAAPRCRRAATQTTRRRASCLDSRYRSEPPNARPRARSDTRKRP